MSTTEDSWGLSKTAALHNLGWRFNEDNSGRQVPSDHRSNTEAWVNADGDMKIGEVGNEEAWISSDFVSEVRE